MTPWTWIGFSLVLSQSTAPDGYITGRVVATEGGKPVAYANLLVVGNSRGAMTDATGHYVMPVPPGSHRLRVMMMLYRDRETDVVVMSGDTTQADFQLDPIGLTRAQAEAESIGVDVHVSADELPCEILAMKDRFVVGDYPAFTMSIRNESKTPIVLAGALDGSERSARYPRIVWNIEGPDGPLKKQGLLYCGNLRRLETSDFVFVPPGVDFHPYADLEAIYRSRTHCDHCLAHEFDAFDHPGRYTITVSYVTDEPDIRRWVSWEESRLAPGVSEAVRRVPLVTLTASTVVDVEAE